YFDPILRRRVREMPGVTILYDTEITGVSDEGDHTLAHGIDLERGGKVTIKCDYLVGCDGGNSLVRKAMGTEFVGDGLISQTRSVFIRSCELREKANVDRAWMTWFVGNPTYGCLISLNGEDHWVFLLWLPEGVSDFEALDPRKAIRNAFGKDFDFTIEKVDDWYGRRLVADHFHKGRLLLCGDASHIWIPFAGYGMNAGVADAATLGWQLAAVINGWGGPSMLDAYQAERQPVTHQVSQQAMSLALSNLNMEHAGKQVEDEEITEVLKGKGLGTPATRADIIENLVSKQYARRAEKTLRATPKGILLIDLLRRIRAERLASPRLTGELELHLAEVESGQRSRDDFMSEVVEYTEEIVRLAKTFQYDELYHSDPPLGDCPIAKHLKVVERSRFYCSEDNTGKNGQGVGFIIWKEKNGRYVDRTAMVELLTHGETPLLDGFLTSRGQGYKGKLRLDKDGNLELVSEDGKVAGGPVAVAEIPEDATPLVDCPFNSDCQIFQTEVAYQCRCDETCKATHKKLKSVAILPRVVCHREINPEEAVQFFAEGKTDEWDNFISRYGRPFKAKLFLKDNGKHGFEFAPRAPKKKKEKAGAEAAPGEKKTKAKTKAKKSKSKAKSKTKAKTTKAKTTKTKTKARAKKE
ncbi:MAG: FAD-dependent monooxygenase, partial [Candidatus Eremiobacteraeota bacterium]|nr:FAD-dependent monooxygenase [Candidatus Eremiobacteraeota bacterium]